MILLSVCAPNIIKADCKEDVNNCLDHLEKINDEYKKCLTSLYDTNTLLKQYMVIKQKNAIFPYVGFRYTDNLIVPQVGLGYFRKLKSVNFKNRSFSVGVGGLFDVAFNSESIHSIGIAASVIFQF